MMSVPIKAVPLARVLTDNLLNFTLKPGSPNPLKVAARGESYQLIQNRRSYLVPLMQPEYSRSFPVTPMERNQNPSQLMATLQRVNHKLHWWPSMSPQKVTSLQIFTR